VEFATNLWGSTSTRLVIGFPVSTPTGELILARVFIPLKGCLHEFVQLVTRTDSATSAFSFRCPTDPHHDPENKESPKNDDQKAPHRTR